MTNRKETLEIFLALATAARDGIITDTLWMPAGQGTRQETVFEFLADKVGYPGNLAHIDSLVESLENEIEAAKGKV